MFIGTYVGMCALSLSLSFFLQRRLWAVVVANSTPTHSSSQRLSLMHSLEYRQPKMNTVLCVSLSPSPPFVSSTPKAAPLRTFSWQKIKQQQENAQQLLQAKREGSDPLRMYSLSHTYTHSCTHRPNLNTTLCTALPCLALRPFAYSLLFSFLFFVFFFFSLLPLPYAFKRRAASSPLGKRRRRFGREEHVQLPLSHIHTTDQGLCLSLYLLHWVNKGSKCVVQLPRICIYLSKY